MKRKQRNTDARRVEVVKVSASGPGGELTLFSETEKLVSSTISASGSKKEICYQDIVQLPSFIVVAEIY